LEHEQKIPPIANSTPLVTVITTICGRDEYLAAALDGAMSQTFKDFDIIVTDDANREETKQICALYSNDARLRYRANSANLGVVGNVRAAWSEARGKYLAILNDDDRWDPDFLLKLVEALEADNRSVLAFCDHWIINERDEVDVVATDANTRHYGRQSLEKGAIPDPAASVLISNSVPLAMGSVFRKDAIDIDELYPEVIGAYDLWLACLLAKAGGAFLYLPERLTYYRVHGQSETARFSPYKTKNAIFIYECLLKKNWFPNHAKHLKICLASIWIQSGKHLLSHGAPKKARESFVTSICIAPGWKALIGWVLTFVPVELLYLLKIVPCHDPNPS